MWIPQFSFCSEIFVAPHTKSSERILVFHRAVMTSMATKLSTFVLCVVCMCAGVCVII